MKTLVLYNQDRIKFGKYKGTLISNLPLDYRNWLKDTGGYTFKDYVLKEKEPEILIKKESKGVWIQVREAKILVSVTEAATIAKQLNQILLG